MFLRSLTPLPSQTPVLSGTPRCCCSWCTDCSSSCRALCCLLSVARLAQLGGAGATGHGRAREDELWILMSKARGRVRVGSGDIGTDKSMSHPCRRPIDGPRLLPNLQVGTPRVTPGRRRGSSLSRAAPRRPPRADPLTVHFPTSPPFTPCFPSTPRSSTPGICPPSRSLACAVALPNRQSWRRSGLSALPRPQRPPRRRCRHRGRRLSRSVAPLAAPLPRLVVRAAGGGRR